MIARENARNAVQRLCTVWPMMNKRDELRQEIGGAIMAAAEKLEPLDVERGVSLLIRTSATKANDGGPAWPPGPNEVMGCILKERANRLDTAPKAKEPSNTAPLSVVNRNCCRSSCKGALEYVATERVLRCVNCRSVQVKEWVGGTPRIHLTHEEASALRFSSEPAPVATSADAVAVLKEIAERRPVKVLRRMTELAS